MAKFGIGNKFHDFKYFKFIFSRILEFNHNMTHHYKICRKRFNLM